MTTPQGLISKPASRYTNTTFNRAFIKGQLQQQMKDSLLTKAESTVPDANAIGEKLNEYELHSGDRAFIGNIVQSNIKAFNKDYSENPFNAFTKSSKTKLSNISQALNSPEITGYMERKKLDDAVIKSADDAGLSNNLQIRGEQIKVKTADGNSGWINYDVWRENQDKYVALTVGRDYLNTAQLGARQSGAFEVNMNEYAKILTKVNNIFDNVGKNKDTRFSTASGLLETINESTNKGQLAAAYSYLVDSGLTTQDVNTLVSEELKRNVNQTYEQARTNALGAIANLAASKTDNEVSRSRKKNPLATGTNSDGSGKSGISGAANAQETDAVMLGDNASDSFVFRGTTGSLNDISGIEGSLYNTKAVNYGGILDNGTTETVGDTDVLSRKIVDIPAINDAVSLGLRSGNIMMLNSKGELESVRADMMKNSSVYNSLETSPKKVMHLEDNDGNWAPISIMQLMDDHLKKVRADPSANIPIPPKLNNYFSQNEVLVNGVKSKQANYVPYLTFTALVQTTDNDIVGDETREQLRSDNTVVVDGGDSALTDEVYAYQVKYNGLDPTDTLIDDDVALPTIFVKMVDFDNFRQQMGGNITVPKSQLEAQDVRTRQQQIYIPSSNFSTNSAIPSQVNGSALPTLSGTN